MDEQAMHKLPTLDGSDPERWRVETLRQAFLVFNQLAETLTASYRELEAQVARLNQELAAAQSERLAALIEKEKLANRLGHLLEVLPGGVIVLDGEGRVVEHNPAAVELVGEPLLGERWAAVRRRSFIASGHHPYEHRLKNGRVVNISSRSLGDEPGQILLLIDVTEVQALKELVDQHQRLAAMGEMVARLAHQVRTPLAAALLYATQLGEEGLSKEQRLRFTAKLVERLKYLERQVNDMLMFSRKGRFVTETIPVAILLKRLAEVAEPKAAGSSVKLSFTDLSKGAVLEGNLEALLGGLLNLIDNALEALAGEGQIEVRAEREGRLIRLSVIDDGPGMDEAVRSRAFEPFFTTRPNGTGLGLAVLDSIVRAHGGSVRCESMPGRTAFHVCLPPAQGSLPLQAGVLSAQVKEASR
jgi:two-component system sensor histidine kinase FlrB